jgi:hypothetical protein
MGLLFGLDFRHLFVYYISNKFEHVFLRQLTKILAIALSRGIWIDSGKALEKRLGWYRKERIAWNNILFTLKILLAVFAREGQKIKNSNIKKMIPSIGGI